MRARSLLQTSILGVCLSGSAATAGEIYKWTGADGVTHYSESAPALPGGGVPKPFTYISETFLPKLQEAGVDDATIRQLTHDNPFRAFSR